MIPHLRLALYIAIPLLCVVTGYKVANWRRDSQDLVALQAAEKAGERATTAAVDAIQTLNPKFADLRRALNKATHEAPQYRDPVCNHSDAGWLLIESAYKAAGGSWGGGTGVPDAASAVGSQP